MAKIAGSIPAEPTLQFDKAGLSHHEQHIAIGGFACDGSILAELTNPRMGYLLLRPAPSGVYGPA